MQNRPYTETYSDGWYERVFEADIESGEMRWHRDREDRYVEPIEPTNWMFQLENELPIKIEGRLFVPKGAWHRAIKGTGDLKIRIKKI
jgi:hypothetical protein